MKDNVINYLGGQKLYNTQGVENAISNKLEDYSMKLNEYEAVQIGETMFWQDMNNLPAGWIKLDGQELDVDKYEGLAKFFGGCNIANGKLCLPVVKDKIIKAEYAVQEVEEV